MAFWERPYKKTLFTLNIGNYQPDITALTFPLMKRYAKKIGADFHVITERRFPTFPIAYEKFQIYELAQQMGNDWNIYMDADALVHPSMFDVTSHLHKDTVCHHGLDVATTRWKYDRIFRRDGRHLGSGNWFTIASDWCIELWKPLDDLTMEEALANIHPTLRELQGGITPDHLLDDYTCSRNIAMYGLKCTCVRDLYALHKVPDGTALFYHKYAITEEQKLAEMKQTLAAWQVEIKA